MEGIGLCQGQDLSTKGKRQLRPSGKAGLSTQAPLLPPCSCVLVTRHFCLLALVSTPVNLGSLSGCISGILFCVSGFFLQDSTSPLQAQTLSFFWSQRFPGRWLGMTPEATGAPCASLHLGTWADTSDQEGNRRCFRVERDVSRQRGFDCPVIRPQGTAGYVCSPVTSLLGRRSRCWPPPSCRAALEDGTRRRWRSPVQVGLGVHLGLGVRLGLGVHLGLRVHLRLGVCLGLGVHLGLGVRLGLRVHLGLGVHPACSSLTGQGLTRSGHPGGDGSSSV